MEGLLHERRADDGVRALVGPAVAHLDARRARRDVAVRVRERLRRESKARCVDAHRVVEEEREARGRHVLALPPLALEDEATPRAHGTAPPGTRELCAPPSESPQEAREDQTNATEECQVDDHELFFRDWR